MILIKVRTGRLTKKITHK